ncbi:hypothetical protein DOM22_16390 [Bdellovibrio sp. ZAP7]|uniref:hypothetical protein n=1 Tax=Bdellovibrio sp. ZAP7 TaxID=2231053 RepID=UPI00115B2318|nr:hypothetical protein [Bdellovibrio sp. ZAP7]QDK46620.1 hypothetical protein DOM22_16390 [Bdellovibrio sp. ZAP7]
MNNLKLITVTSALLFSANSIAFTIQLPTPPPIPGASGPCFPHEKPLPLPKFEFPKLKQDQCIGILCSTLLEQIVAPGRALSSTEVATQIQLIEKNIAAIEMLEQAMSYSAIFDSIQDLRLQISYPPEDQAMQEAMSRFKQTYAGDYEKAFTDLNLEIKQISSDFEISRDVLFRSFIRMLTQGEVSVHKSVKEYKSENVQLLITYQEILNTLSK